MPPGNVVHPKVLARFKGSKLDRLECGHAWIDRPSLLMVGEHVTLGGEADAETELDVSEAQKKAPDSKAGTGAVHTAPGHGHDDFVIGKRYGLDIYCPVDNAGRFTPEVEHFAGQRVFEANKQIVEFMKERGVLLFSEDYNHRYPHCWRCKNPVIFRATPQWFIAMDQAHQETVEKDEDGRDRTNYTDNLSETPATSLRTASLREIENVNWVPAWGVDRMRNMLKGRPDWCVSRQRVWGVSIPGFLLRQMYNCRCRPGCDSSCCRHFEKESGDAWYTREATDLLPAGYTCNECGANEWTKETDILDVWFDSGVSSGRSVGESRRTSLAGRCLHRRWRSVSWLVQFLVDGRTCRTTIALPYKTVITHGWTLDGQGRAMHKSPETQSSRTL
jgi:isoleucyl-tRNA synthetase